LEEKWFYIKDRKVSSSDQYGIAPFDASKEVKILALWDSPPTEAEMEEIKPLLAHIQELKSAKGGALSGTQLMAYFLQYRVQPLQHRLSKLWTFSGLGDSSQVSEDLMEKKDLDKRVLSLKIIKSRIWLLDISTPSILYLRYVHYLYSPSSCLIIVCLVTLDLFSFQDHQSPISHPPLPEGGAIQNVLVSAASEAPEAEDSQDGDEGQDSLERPSSTMSPPPALSKDLGVDRKRKRVEEFVSSSASAHKTVAGETLDIEDDEELFDALDS
jgi:hypothetical protein